MGNGADVDFGLHEAVAVGQVRGKGGAGGDDGLRIVPDMVPVPMRADDEPQVPAFILELLGQPADGGRCGIDGDGFLGADVAKDPDIGGERPGRQMQHLHASSIATTT